MRSKELLNESMVKAPITFTYTDKNGRFLGDVVYISVDSKDLRDMLMFCMEADDPHVAGLIAEISAKYVSKYRLAVAKRKKELGIK